MKSKLFVLLVLILVSASYCFAGGNVTKFYPGENVGLFDGVNIATGTFLITGIWAVNSSTDTLYYTIADSSGSGNYDTTVVGSWLTGVGSSSTVTSLINNETGTPIYMKLGIGLKIAKASQYANCGILIQYMTKP